MERADEAAIAITKAIRGEWREEWSEETEVMAKLIRARDLALLDEAIDRLPEVREDWSDCDCRGRLYRLREEMAR